MDPPAAYIQQRKDSIIERNYSNGCRLVSPMYPSRLVRTLSTVGNTYTQRTVDMETIKIQ